MKSISDKNTSLSLFYKKQFITKRNDPFIQLLYSIKLNEIKHQVMLKYDAQTGVLILMIFTTDIV